MITGYSDSRPDFLQPSHSANWRSPISVGSPKSCSLPDASRPYHDLLQPTEISSNILSPTSSDDFSFVILHFQFV